MAKKEPAGFIDPENLWAKPHPRPTKTPEPTRMDTEEEYTDDNIDVDAELEAADQAEEEYDDEPSDELVAAGDEEIDGEDEIDDYAAEVGDEIAADSGDEFSQAANKLQGKKADTVESTVDYDEFEEGTVDDDDAVEVADTKESRKGPMADKKKTSISDHVRVEIEKRKASGASLRGVEIVAALEKRGITVSPAQVSQLLKKAGVAPGKKGRQVAATAQPAGANEKSRAALKASKLTSGQTLKRLKRREMPATPATSPVVRAAAKATPAHAATSEFSISLSIAQMRAAKGFVDTCGGSFEKASRILSETAQLARLAEGFINNNNTNF